MNLERYKWLACWICGGILLLLNSCQLMEKERVQREVDWRKTVFYEIFVQSFADSNGDGIGDIPGMTQKISYLKDLGVNAVWLMPISPSPSYHKYDVTDYYGIHEDYGSASDFKTFVKNAHENDISVIVDLVINHTSSEHPWFQNAKKGTQGEFRDYYVWANKDSIAKQIAKKKISFDSDNLQQWHAVDGDENAEHYYGYFYGGMPDLNYDNQDLRKEIYKIGRYWLDEMDVDGFRLDAAKHIYPDDRSMDSRAFWAEFKREMEKVKPNVYLVGEVWADAKEASPFAQGFTSLFNFDLAFSILESVRQSRNVSVSITSSSADKTKGDNIAKNYNLNLQKYLYHNPDFIESNFLSNHDQNRVSSVLKGDADKIKLAASVLLTLPGTPYVYYGEELGMPGMKPDEYIREPLLWDIPTQDQLRTQWMKPKYAKDSMLNNVSVQLADSSSVLNHYKDLIALRKANEALSIGEIIPSNLNHSRVLAYTRKSASDQVFVIHNLGLRKLKFAISESREFQQLLWQSGGASNNDGVLTIEGRSSAVFGI